MRRAALLALLLAGAIFALDRALPPDLSRLAPAGVEVLDRERRPLALLPAPGGVWRFATRAEDVPPHLLALLIEAEDRRFRWHPGVDPLALARAAAQWARQGRVVSGGSTITMQVARLLEPRPRTLRAKAIETVRALQLEARFGKDEILAMWLTLAPQGGNLEGVRAGARAGFGPDAARLDVSEAALLVALARRPEALRPDRHADAARSARDALLTRRAARAAGISEADRAIALASDVPHARRSMPGLAPHLARAEARGGERRAAGGVIWVPGVACPGLPATRMWACGRRGVRGARRGRRNGGSSASQRSSGRRGCTPGRLQTSHSRWLTSGSAGRWRRSRSAWLS
jgi:penicillin-binding protein 1C